MKADLIKAFNGAQIYFEKKDALKFSTKPNSYLVTVFGKTKEDIIQDAPDFMLQDKENIYFVINLQPKIKDLKKAILNARKKFNTYHYLAFFKDSEEPKLAHCVLLVKKNNLKKLKEALQTFASKRPNIGYNWFDFAKVYTLGKYEGISLTISVFYEVVILY
ncbi:MAG: hypothetical protein WCW13_06945 [archaeon]